MPGEDIQLGALPEMVGVELRIAQILADRAFRDAKRQTLPSGHYTVLALLHLNPGINQSALARSMYLQRSSMVPILDQFEKKGWIERRSQSSDRRSYALYLTPEGENLLEQVDMRVQSLEKSIAERMGAKNRAQLLTLLKQFQSIVQDL